LAWALISKQGVERGPCGSVQCPAPWPGSAAQRGSISRSWMACYPVMIAVTASWGLGRRRSRGDEQRSPWRITCGTYLCPTSMKTHHPWRILRVMLWEYARTLPTRTRSRGVTRPAAGGIEDRWRSHQDSALASCVQWSKQRKSLLPIFPQSSLLICL
jgi:hypothetical protein